MLRFPCASLSSLAGLLRERYDLRNTMIIRHFSDPDLLAAEREIIRMNRLISRHRRRCPQCKLRESLVASNTRSLKLASS